jgi:hypothetical protein
LRRCGARDEPSERELEAPREGGSGLHAGLSEISAFIAAVIAVSTEIEEAASLISGKSSGSEGFCHNKRSICVNFTGFGLKRKNSGKIFFYWRSSVTPAIGEAP